MVSSSRGHRRMRWRQLDGIEIKITENGGMVRVRKRWGVLRMGG